jgi:hypothetical protein
MGLLFEYEEPKQVNAVIMVRERFTAKPVCSLKDCAGSRWYLYWEKLGAHWPALSSIPYSSSY